MPRRRRQPSRSQSSDSLSSRQSVQNSSQPDQKKSKKVKTSQKTSTSANSQQIMNDAIDAVVNNSQVSDTSVLLSDTETNNNDKYFQLEKQVKSLSETVQKQASEISDLKSKLSFILSYIGVNDSSDAPISTATDINTKSLLLHAADITNDVSGHNDAVVEPTDSQALPNGSSYSAVVMNASQNNSQPKLNRTIKSGDTLCQSVVTAMYVEQKQKDRRANTFIVTGLPIENDVDDKTKVQNICKNHVGVNIDTNIVSIRRLGTPKPAKLQPVLVILKDKSLALQIIQNAKLLRQSNSAYIRQAVYINQNLTRAEATAAYYFRCQKRQNTNRNSSATNQNAKLLNVNNSRVTIDNTAAPAPVQSTSDAVTVGTSESI